MSWFWQTVLSNSAIAAGLAAVALLIGRSPRRAATAHLVWAAVLVKLLTPPLFVCELPAAVPPLRPVTPAVGAGSQAGAMPRSEGPSGPPGSGSGRPVVAEVGPRDRAATPASVEADRARRWPWGAIIGPAWVVLSLALLSVAAIRLGKFRRCLKDFPQASGEIRAIAAGLAGRLGLSRVPEVRVAPGVLPPLVWSLGGPPVVVLPGRLVDRWGSDELAAVLAHELAHVRRGDHLVRFLELACAVALPWHPLVWLATRRLRDLEERCCDARVLEVCPDRPRAYALALVATLEFLSGRRVPAVPLRTAIRSAHPLARRLAMLHQTPPRRLSAAGLALVAGLLVAPLALTFAQAPTPTVRPDSIVRPVDPPAEPAIVRGRVVDKDGAPVADARVRVAIPAADMRLLGIKVGWPDTRARPEVREARTDAEGRYEFNLPGLLGKGKASFDVLKPGFRRLAGTLMAGGDAKEVEVEPGRTVDISLTLTEPTRHYRGVIVDEAGRPVADAQIAQYVLMKRSGGTGGGEVTASRADGTFELFNVDPEAHRWRKVEGTSFAVFEHPDYVPGRIDDLHAIPEGEQDKVRVVLKAGRSVAGTVRDAAGKPVAGALVAVEYGQTRQDAEKRKATLTNPAGQFALRGLADGPAEVKVRALAIDQKGKVALPAASTDDLSIRLEPIGLPADLKTYDVLEMKLADVTPALQTAYDLYHPKGAVVIDAGPNPARLGIGALDEGCEFWMVGGGRGRQADGRREGEVTDVRDFVRRVLDESKKDQARATGVRVVYTFDRPEYSGTSTQYLKLTPDDLRELQAFADRLAK